MTDRAWIVTAGLAFLVLLGVGFSAIARNEVRVAPMTGTMSGASTEGHAVSKTTDAEDGQLTAIVGAKVFDGEDFTEDSVVVFSGQEILEVGSGITVPSNAKIIDGKGKTLLPGLIDSHVHSFGSALEDSLLFGVTTVLDMFTDQGQAEVWRGEQAAGDSTFRADIFSAGTLVTAPGGHGTQFGMEIPTITSPEEADEFVAARVAEGSDFIKIILEDGSLYGRPLATLDEPTLKAVVAAAHSRDKLAVAHVSILDKARQAVATGVDGLVHLFYDQPVDEAWLSDASDHGLFVVPTMTILESAAGRPSGSYVVSDERLSPYLSAEATAGLKRVFPQRVDTFDLALTNLRALDTAGIKILAGTDAPNPGTWWGVSMHRELELLVEAGLSPAEALRAATSSPADAFDLSDRGRIAPGKLADLVLIDGDPEESILDTRAIAAVWRRGVAVERVVATLDAASERDVLAPGPVADLESPAKWQTSTDEMMGGKSTVEMSVVKANSLDSLEIHGEIVTGFPFPWAGAMYFPGPVPMAPMDASALTELVFWAKGDGTEQRVMFFAESLGQMPGQTGFTAPREWTKIVIPFSAISGLDPAGLTAVLFSGPMTLGEFDFTINRIEFR